MDMLIWKGDSGQREQPLCRSYRKWHMERFGEENKLLVGHLVLQVFMYLYINDKGNGNGVDFSWAGCFDALLKRLACEMLPFVLGAAYYCY